MVEILTHSEAGGHAINEDAFAVGAHPDDADCLLAFLADGQGGRAGARWAAELACRTALQAASASSRRQLGSSSSWQSILQHADHAVANDARAGFTTLIGLCVLDEFAYGASCGDSAVLVVNERKADAVLTSRQVKNPPVGSGAAEFVSFSAQLCVPWVLLAMSDGVWKYVGWEHLVKVSRREVGPHLIRSMQDHARLPGSGQFQDDFTLVVIHRAKEECVDAEP